MPGIGESRDKWANIFIGPDTVQESMSHEDPVSVAKFINECQDKVYAPAAGPTHDVQASDQPNVAARDLMMVGEDDGTRDACTSDCYKT